MHNSLNVVTIFKKDDVTFDIQFIKPNENGVNEPHDITSHDVEIRLPGVSADVVLTSSPAVGITVTDALKGKIQVEMTDTQTNLLKPGERQTFYAILKLAGEETTVKFKQALTVDERNFKA